MSDVYDIPIWMKTVAASAVAGGGALAAAADSIAVNGRWLDSLGRQAPALTVLCVLVYLFLKHLSDSARARSVESAKRDNAQQTAEAERDRRQHEVLIRATDALDRTSETLGAVLEVIRVLDLRTPDRELGGDRQRRRL